MDIKNYLMQFYVDQNGEVISPELATMLVSEMAITDGSDRTNGEKWTMSETQDVGDRLGVDWNRIIPCEWYVVMNMMYSDYYSVGKAHSMTDWTFYAELTMAWFNDVDGKENKTFKYFFS